MEIAIKANNEEEAIRIMENYEFFVEEWQDEYGTYGHVPEIDSEDYLTWISHQEDL